jgi:hypothetical protein
MKGSIMSQSLKASKQVAHSPSKAETILTDAVKLTLANVTGEATQAYTMYSKAQDASQAYETTEKVLVKDLYTYLHNAKPDYPTFQAVKKHIISSIATSKGFKFETIEKWLNKSVIKLVVELGYELPKAESKNAESMAKLRAELSSIDDKTLDMHIETLAKAGDKESLKRATQLATEKEKRKTQAQNAIKKTESKATSELKAKLKSWIGGADADLLVALLWAKNHQEQLIKMSKAK